MTNTQKLKLADGQELSFFNVGNVNSGSIRMDSAGSLRISGNGGDVAIESGASLRFLGTSAYIGGAQPMILSLGNAGDTVNLNVPGVTYNIATSADASVGNLTAANGSFSGPVTFNDVITVKGQGNYGMTSYGGKNDVAISLEHPANGSSSIYFKSTNNSPSDFGYIRFEDDRNGTVGGEVNQLTIGVENDGSSPDRIQLKGFTFINSDNANSDYTRIVEFAAAGTTKGYIDASGNMNLNGGLTLGTTINAFGGENKFAFSAYSDPHVGTAYGLKVSQGIATDKLHVSGVLDAFNVLTINRAGQDLELLKFNTERPWSFFQGSTGATTNLLLKSSSSDKSFIVQSPAALNSLSVLASDTTANNRVDVLYNLYVGNTIYENGTSLGGKYVGLSRAITAGSGLTGGGDLTADRSLAVNFTTSGGNNGTATTVARGDHNHDNVYVKLAGSTMTGFLTLSADPTSALHAATKQYVDSAISGLDVKKSVRAATISGQNITLTGDTQSGSTSYVIDGVTLSNSDRVLVKNQTTASENGLYTVAITTTSNTYEVASLSVTSAPTASGNVTVTLNGVATNIAVTTGTAEVASLTISAAATTAGNVTVTLNGVATNVAVAAGDTASGVADKIRATAFTGWTTGGTTGTATVTFTATAVGVKTDATYSSGTTGATGTMSTTTQGVDADTTTTVATKIRGTAFSGWTTGGSGTTVTFTATSYGNKTDATYSAGTTSAAGTMSTTTQGSSATATAVYTRTTGSDSTTEMNPGAFTFVEQGTVNADTGWIMSSDTPFTLGTSAANWTQFSSAGVISVDTTLSKSGNIIGMKSGVATAGTYPKVTVDTYGRITAGANLSSGDVTTGLGYTPLNKAGDTMSGQINMNTQAIMFATGGGQIRAGGTGSTSIVIGAPTANIYIRPNGDTSSTGEVLLTPTAFTYNANTIWHAGNDGTGSGLDADLLDGHDASYFATATHTHTLAVLTDTTITSPASGNFLRYNGTAWVNTALTAADIPSLDWSKITTGKPTTLSGYGITDALNLAGGTLTGNTNISGSSSVFTAKSGAYFAATNPTNDTASISLSWLNDAPRLRIGGSGTGSTATFSIQGVADAVKWSVDSAGNTISTGTDQATAFKVGSTTVIESDAKIAWDKLKTLPTTLNGYGITDALSKSGGVTYWTTNTSSTYANQYTKLASITINGQYGYGNTTIIMTAGADGNPTNRTAKVNFRVKQQNAMAGAPSYDLNVVDARGCSPADFSAVITVNSASATTVELYMKVTVSYEMYRFIPIIQNTSNAVFTFYDNQGYIAALPAGTVITATDLTPALSTDVVTTAIANKLLKLDGSGNLPASVTGNAATATKLLTARTIAASGDATGTATSFDGSANITIPLTLANSGVTAGTYTKLTVDAKGRATSGASLTATDITTALGYTPWYSGNDGAGSGLDADTVQGKGISTGSTDGTLLLDKLALIKTDGVMEIAKYLDMHDHSNATQVDYDARFSVTGAGTVGGGTVTLSAAQLNVGSSKVWHAGNDGAGSALDADLLDGLDGTAYARSNADTTLTNATVTSIANTTNGLFLPILDGGSLMSSASSVTGAIKITLPVSWTSTMIKFHVDVYDYATGESWTASIAGYNYSATSAWQNTTATIMGSRTDRKFTVRYGHDGTHCCIYIGELTSTWSYPQIRVRDFVGGFQNYTTTNFRSGWTIGFEATAFGTLTSTITDTLVYSGVAESANKLSTARTISLTTDVTGSVTFDGSGDVSLTASVVDDSHNHTYLKNRGNVAAETGVNNPAVTGFSMSSAYSNGYPTTYGNVLTLSGSGHGQLLVGWSGSSSTDGVTQGLSVDNYIRSKRDTANASWSAWAKIWTDQNFTPANKLDRTGDSMLSFASNKYYIGSGGGAYALNLNNSDIIGANNIIFKDASGSSEGIRFAKSTAAADSQTATDYDTFRVLDGTAYVNSATIMLSTGGTMTGNFSANTLSSTVATGTAPLTVASTTMVTNLNAQMVNGVKFFQGTTAPASPTVGTMWIDTN